VTTLPLGPPGYTPQLPGSMESTALTGLTPGVTFYFALRSTSLGNVMSPIDTRSATPGSQAFAYSASLAVHPPGTFTGIALSPTRIQWNWSLVAGATGYLIYSEPSDTLIQTLGPSTTYWTETGLSSNTFVTRDIRAADNFGASITATAATRSTLALAPQAITVTAVTSTSADLAWDDGGNPSGTLFSLERSLDDTVFAPFTTATSTFTTDAGLLGATTYYYRVQAVNGDNVGTAYSVETSTTTSPAFVTPLAPNGLLTSRNGTTFKLEWHAVPAGVAGQPVTISKYRIDRYSDIASSAPNTTTYVPGTTLAYTDTTTGNPVQFYRVTALAVGGGVSDPSDFVDNAGAGNRYTIAPDDPATRIVTPAAAANELRKENNIYGEDLEMRLVRRQQDEVDTTLRSYGINAYIARTGSQVFNFAFSKPIISVQLGYGAALGVQNIQTDSPSGNRSLGAKSTSAGSIAQIVAVYWNNGRDFIRISDPVLTSNQSLGVTVRSLGTYQLRATRLSNSFSLAAGSPYPRVITPNGGENRKVFFFFDNPNGEQVLGTIYDIRGAKVRELRVDGDSPTSSSLVWDGHDSHGAIVPSGVYLYKITAGQDKVTGSVVVAR